MSQAPGQPRSGALIALALVALLAVFVLYAVMVQTEGGQDLDASAFSGPEPEPGLGSDLASSLLQAFTLGSMALASLTIAGIGYVRGRLPLALVPVAVVAGSLATTELLKHVFLDRPDLLGTGDVENTFPSGHTTIATGIGIGALLVAPPWMRLSTGIGAVALAAVIGVATVAGGWHRPSDVLGAYLVTVGVAALVVVALRARGRVPLREPAAREFWALGAAALGAVLGILIAFAIGIADNADEVDWAAVDRGLLASAVALPVCAAVLILALAAAVFRTSNESAPA